MIELTRRQTTAGVAALAFGPLIGGPAMANTTAPDLILTNARFTTLDKSNPNPEAVAIKDGRFSAVGDARDIMPTAGPATRLLDLGGRRAIPGLNDSHTHLIRGGLNYNMELRWDGVPTLADAMAMLRTQAQNTPPPQWVRVVGGFTENQWPEKRLPTLAELNAAAPDTPVFILHLYGSALLNRAALRAVGYTADTPDPPGGMIERDARGEPTGLLLARPNALILYNTLAMGPKLEPEQQLNSTRHYMRELNRAGITSVIDAGGGFQNYPDDYAIIEKLHRDGELTVRIAYNLFTQKVGEELDDFMRWTNMATPHQGHDYRLNGAGEMLVFSAADFEHFMEPRPDLDLDMENQLHGVVRHLAENRWPFRIHATYDELIDRFLDVFEAVDHEVPFAGLRFTIDHAETITPRNIERVGALGGGIAIQHRIAYQGEYFVDRYGARAAERTPPVARMLADGVPVGAGTDATRVASYNPWVTLSWLVTGKTVGGLTLYPARNRLDRETALRLMTKGSAWFSSEEDVKGAITVGELADLAVLTSDYMSVPENELAHLASVLTIVGGRIVHGAEIFRDLAPPLPPPSPDWSPVRTFGGYHRREEGAQTVALARQVSSACGCGTACGVHGHAHAQAWAAPVPASDARTFWGALGCACWAV